MEGTSRVAFLGLGRIGFPVALNLARKGFRVLAFDPAPQPPRVEALREGGGALAGTAAEAVADADVAVTLLPDSEAVESSLLDVDTLRALPEGVLVVDMTSGDPSATRRIAEALRREKAARFVDAPICNGGVPGAYEGQLTLMVGGSDGDVRDLKSFFEAVAKEVQHVGPVGSGQVVKLLSNYLVFAACGALTESLGLAEANGIPAGQAVEFLSSCAGAKFIAMDHVPRAVLQEPADEPARFRLALARKDLRYMMLEGARAGLVQPVAGATHELFLLAERDGLGDAEATSGPWRAATGATR